MQKITNGIKTYFKHADMLLLGLAFAASAFGLILIFSSTRSYDTNKFVIIQGLAILLGVLGFILVSMVDMERLGQIWKFVFVFNLLLQASLFVLGEAGDSGNRSWIRFGPIGIQPAEIGKILFIFTFSRHVYDLRDKINRPFSVLQLCLHGALTMGVIMASSSDLGMTIVYMIVFIVLLYAGGLSYKWLGGMALCAAAAAPVLWSKLGDFQRLRILVVFEPSLSEKYAYQAKQGMTAIGSGQLFGQGLLQGKFTQSPSALPAKHTDFIFAAAGEELGFIGLMAIIAILSFIILRIFYDSTKTTSQFGRLMCIGIGGMIMAQSIINIGMCMGVLPVIGLTLPFFSYGGTSAMTTVAALGIVCGFAMRVKPSWLR